MHNTWTLSDYGFVASAEVIQHPMCKMARLHRAWDRRKVKRSQITDVCRPNFIVTAHLPGD